MKNTELTYSQQAYVYGRNAAGKGIMAPCQDADFMGMIREIAASSHCAPSFSLLAAEWSKGKQNANDETLAFIRVQAEVLTPARALPHVLRRQAWLVWPGTGHLELDRSELPAKLQRAIVDTCRSQDGKAAKPAYEPLTAKDVEQFKRQLDDMYYRYQQHQETATEPESKAYWLAQDVKAAIADLMNQL